MYFSLIGTTLKGNNLRGIYPYSNSADNGLQCLQQKHFGKLDNLQTFILTTTPVKLPGVITLLRLQNVI